MARPKSAALLEAKLEEAERLKTEIRKLRNAARDKTRARDEERGKVLGRIVLAHMTANPESELALSVNRLLAGQLKRPSERELFPELSAKPTKSPADEEKAV
jgi:hypothetical protein